ncbi:hypothetical protein Tco_0734938 [Tanacetum coccineum]
MIGSLKYLISSRPDLVFAICMCEPFVDADHAGCQATRRSTSGNMQLLGDRIQGFMVEERRRFMFVTFWAAVVQENPRLYGCKDVKLDAIVMMDCTAVGFKYDGIRLCIWLVALDLGLYKVSLCQSYEDIEVLLLVYFNTASYHGFVNTAANGIDVWFLVKKKN